MQIQVNTSNGLENKETLERWADAEVRQSLHRFADDVTRVEIHLSDENHSTGGADKKCLMEARLAHHQPLVATEHAANIDAAFRGAMDKLKRLLESKLGREAKHRDRASIRTTDDLVPDAAP